MKSLIFTILLFYGTIHVFAQVIGLENIIVSGNNDKRINVVVLGDGYTSTEQDKFITDVTNFSNAFFNESPFKEYASYFNIYAIKVASNESGADIPRNNIYVDTYFNATFDAFGNQYLLFYEIDGNSTNNTEAKINDVLANHFPNYDVALILVNSPYYGGSGGAFPMSSTNSPWGNRVAIHELAHTLFKLKDEYYPGDLLAEEGINMTQESDPSKVKWKNWININNINVYPYTGSGNASSWYKPANATCIMESIDKKFCSVCKEGGVEKIHDLVSPIDAYTPASNPEDNPTLPIDFNLNLLKPIPNTLQTTWTLNSTTFSENTDGISLVETNLQQGTNTLTAVVHDNATLLKVNAHSSGTHVYTVTWTFNYDTLQIEDIKSSTNEFDITYFPNPSDKLIYLKFKSNQTEVMKVSITDLSGRMVKSFTLSNQNEQAVDISNLEQGIYLINFYSNGTLIASEKIVKN